MQVLLASKEIAETQERIRKRRMEIKYIYISMWYWATLGLVPPHSLFFFLFISMLGLLMFCISLSAIGCGRTSNALNILNSLHNSPRNVSYDHGAIIIDGKPRILISGSIHYPRSTPEVRERKRDIEDFIIGFGVQVWGLEERERWINLLEHPWETRYELWDRGREANGMDQILGYLKFIYGFGC